MYVCMYVCMNECMYVYMDVLCVFSCQRCIRCHSENGKGNDMRSERKISREDIEQIRLNGPVREY